MRSFEERTRSLSLVAPIAYANWTLYQVRSSDFGGTADPADWGMTCIYRFDRQTSPSAIPVIERLISDLREHLQKLPLEVRVVPFSEVGTDYVAQPKAPYDGGYNASRFGDFVAHAECKPPPGFTVAWGALLDVLIENPPDDDALRTVIHHSFIRPWSDLFWDDTRGWTLYLPCFDDAKWPNPC